MKAWILVLAGLLPAPRVEGAKPVIPPPPGPRSQAASPATSAPRLNVVEHRLKNGMKLLIVERHVAPTVAAFILFKVGGVNDPAGQTGVVTTGLPYRYDVRGSDPDGDPITYRLDQAPARMTIDALGRITWSPGISMITFFPSEATAWESASRLRTTSARFGFLSFTVPADFISLPAVF